MKRTHIAMLATCALLASAGPAFAADTVSAGEDQTTTSAPADTVAKSEQDKSSSQSGERKEQK